MILIVCLDDNGGMLFNHRRQSRDRVLNQQILELTQGSKLWMSDYSAKLFAGTDAPQICVEQEFMQKAGSGEYCFLENGPAAPFADRIEKILAFRWNRVYPADQSFDVPLQQWHMEAAREFAGSSHEKITLEVYVK